MSNRYFIINKPYNMVSQFVSPDKVRLLGDLDFNFPEGTHAVGRLDNESEGLLLLTTNKKLTRLLYSGKKKHERSYLIMVQNKVSEEKLAQLQNGISIPVKGGESYIAKPVSVHVIKNPLEIYPFIKDIREEYPHTWLIITLTEGKFRQVRKMVMAIHHRCLRLIRISIGNLMIKDLAPAKVKEINEDELFQLIGII